jgi:hypothetical protein
VLAKSDRFCIQANILALKATIFASATYSLAPVVAAFARRFSTHPKSQ